MKILMSVGGLLLALVLFFLFNVVCNTTLRSSRIDLTSNGLYTLSKGTTNQLAKPRVIRARALHQHAVARLLEPRKHPALLDREVRLELGGEGPGHVPPLRFERARVVTAALRRTPRAAREHERRVVILREWPQVGMALHVALPATLIS